MCGSRKIWLSFLGHIGAKMKKGYQNNSWVMIQQEMPKKFILWGHWWFLTELIFLRFLFLHTFVGGRGGVQSWWLGQIHSHNYRMNFTENSHYTENSQYIKANFKIWLCPVWRNERRIYYPLLDTVFPFYIIKRRQSGKGPKSNNRSLCGFFKRV